MTDAQGGVVSVAGAPWEIKTEKIEWKAGSRRDIGRGLSPMQWQETASRESQHLIYVQSRSLC